MRKLLAKMVFVGSLLVATSAMANEPGWEGRVVRFGAEREKIEETNILNRPYRPLHFYGNTVRRRHYRGTAVPNLRDFGRGGVALVTRR
jgi:hypothetical protein